jgi:hypothetical protein
MLAASKENSIPLKYCLLSVVPSYQWPICGTDGRRHSLIKLQKINAKQARPKSGSATGLRELYLQNAVGQDKKRRGDSTKDAIDIVKAIFL